MSFLKAKVRFPNFASFFSAIEHNSFVLFLAQTLYNFAKSSTLKRKLLGFSSAWVKICQDLLVNLELISQFLFKFSIIVHYYYT